MDRWITGLGVVLRGEHDGRQELARTEHGRRHIRQCGCRLDRGEGVVEEDSLAVRAGWHTAVPVEGRVLYGRAEAGQELGAGSTITRPLTSSGWVRASRSAISPP